jgi:hypothetical protein
MADHDHKYIALDETTTNTGIKDLCICICMCICFDLIIKQVIIIHNFPRTQFFFVFPYARVRVVMEQEV